MLFSKVIILKANIKNRVFNFLVTAILAVMLSHVVVNMSYAESTTGVLVAAESSPIQKTNILEIRRMYLGLPSSTSLIKNTVMNISDSTVYRMFLKNIMHMTDKGYRRKMVKRIFRQGGKKVIEMQDITELVNYLVENPYDVSFMSEDMAKNTKGIKVVQVLW